MTSLSFEILSKCLQSMSLLAQSFCFFITEGPQKSKNEINLLYFNQLLSFLISLCHGVQQDFYQREKSLGMKVHFETFKKLAEATTWL